jgi:hypothetical protein
MNNEELHNLSSSPNIITIIKSYRMGWASYVLCKKKKRNIHKVLYKNLKEIDEVEYLAIHRKVKMSLCLTTYTLCHESVGGMDI